MKKISLDNGRSYITAQEAIPTIAENGLFPALVEFMEDSAREEAHNNTPIEPIGNYWNSVERFLKNYLEIAKNDLIIG